MIELKQRMAEKKAWMFKIGRGAHRAPFAKSSFCQFPTSRFIAIKLNILGKITAVLWGRL
jgi:hypothetical protein